MMCVYHVQHCGAISHWTATGDHNIVAPAGGTDTHLPVVAATCRRQRLQQSQLFSTSK